MLAFELLQETHERFASSILGAELGAEFKSNYYNMKGSSGIKLKVCGITESEQIKALEALGVEYAGLIFYDQSKRYMLRKIMGKEVKNLKDAISLVGVFVNSTEDEILTQVEQYNLTLVQLNGDETPGFCKRISDKVKLIKSFRINHTTTDNIDWQIKPYEDCCDYYLFDSAIKNAGDAGNKYDWQLLSRSKINKPFFLSGGIRPEDAAVIKNFTHPYFYGVDINSRFETTPGIKDIEKIAAFIEEIRADKTRVAAPFMLG